MTALDAVCGLPFSRAEADKKQVDQIWNPDELGICREDVRRKKDEEREGVGFEDLE